MSTRSENTPEPEGAPAQPATAKAAKAEVISYERLYRLWEENNWNATGIDFSVDKEHWRTKLDDRQRESALWNYAMFLVGEEAVARTLTPVLDAAPDYPQSVFLTTQIVDEARHHVFFDRFMREVASQGHDPASTLEAMDRHLTWGFRQVFAELDRVTDALRKKPKDRELLAQTVTIYHLVVEGLRHPGSALHPALRREVRDPSGLQHGHHPRLAR